MAEFSVRQVVVIAALAGALVGGLVAGGVAVAAAGHSNSTASSSGESSQVTTAQVARTTLTNTVQVGGSIGYDGSYTVAALRGGGVYTWLPEPGEVIKQNQPVYLVSDEPVPLLYGSIPAYREFDAGMSDGADVGQLTHDLIALGYGAGLTQSNHYSSATAQDTSAMSDTQLSGLRAWRLGFVFQQFFLLDGLSVLDNVAGGLLYRGGRAADRQPGHRDRRVHPGPAPRAAPRRHHHRGHHPRPRGGRRHGTAHRDPGREDHP